MKKGKKYARLSQNELVARRRDLESDVESAQEQQQGDASLELNKEVPSFRTLATIKTGKKYARLSQSEVASSRKLESGKDLESAQEQNAHHGASSGAARGTNAPLSQNEVTDREQLQTGEDLEANWKLNNEMQQQVTSSSDKPQAKSPNNYTRSTLCECDDNMALITDSSVNAKTQLFEVVVPPGVRPGQSFSVEAYGRRVAVTCPPKARSGLKIRFRIPVTPTMARNTDPLAQNLRASTAYEGLGGPQAKPPASMDYLVTIPDGVYPGMPFTVTINGHAYKWTCPSNAGPGVKIRIDPSANAGWRDGVNGGLPNSSLVQETPTNTGWNCLSKRCILLQLLLLLVLQNEQALIIWGVLIAILVNKRKSERRAEIAAEQRRLAKQQGEANRFEERKKERKKRAMQAVQRNPRVLARPFSDDIRDDKDVALAAVTQDGSCLQYVSHRLKMDADVVLESIRSTANRRDGAFKYAVAQLRDRNVALAVVAKELSYIQYVPDRHLVLEAIQSSGKRSGEALRYVSPDLRDDRDIVFAAVSSCGCALAHSSRGLQNDKEAVMKAIAQDADAIKFASKQCQDDKDIVLAAVSKDGRAIEHASANLRKDPNVLSATLQSEKFSLREAPEKLRDEKDLVLAAITKNPNAIQHASQRLRGDANIALAAIERNGECLKYCADCIRRDKNFVLLAVAQVPEALKYALGGLNQDRDCLIAAGIWDEAYDETESLDVAPQEGTETTKKIVLSTRFSLSEESSEAATRFTIILKQHEYIQGQKFHVYSPNAYEKQTCDPEWTRLSWSCRGTFNTCQMETALKTGAPTDACCWRYSFRYQLEQAAEKHGFMIQVIEIQKNRSHIKGMDGKSLLVCQHTPGQGQRIESQMAQDVGVKVFRIYEPAFGIHQPANLVPRVPGKMLVKKEFTREAVHKLVEHIQDWYKGGCTDMTVVDVKCGEVVLGADVQ